MSVKLLITQDEGESMNDVFADVIVEADGGPMTISSAKLQPHRVASVYVNPGQHVVLRVVEREVKGQESDLYPHKFIERG